MVAFSVLLATSSAETGRSDGDGGEAVLLEELGLSDQVSKEDLESFKHEVDEALKDVELEVNGVKLVGNVHVGGKVICAFSLPFMSS